MQRSSFTSVSRVTLFARQGNPAGRDKFQSCERLEAVTRVMYEVKHMPLVLFHEWILLYGGLSSKNILLGFPLRGYDFYYFSRCRNNGYNIREDR